METQKLDLFVCEACGEESLLRSVEVVWNCKARDFANELIRLDFSEQLRVLIEFKRDDLRTISIQYDLLGV